MTILVSVVLMLNMPPADAAPKADWMKDLDSSDPKILHSAMATATKLGPKAKDAVPRLITILKTAPKATVVYSLDDDAANALAAIGPDAKDAIPELIARLKSANRSSTYPICAAEAITAIAGPHLEAARIYLVEPNVRCGGYKLFNPVLAEKHPDTTVRHLITLAADKEPTVRMNAIGVLGKDDSLAGAGYSKPSELIAKAKDAAKEIPDVLEKSLADPISLVRCAAAKALMATAPDRADKAIAVIIAAIKAREFSHMKAVPGMIGAEYLSPAPDKAYDALRVLLDDENADVRSDTVYILSHLPVETRLEKTILDDQVSRVRAGAAMVLAKKYSARSKPVLTTALKDREFEVRFHAALAITSFSRGDEATATVPALLEGLSSSSPEVRKEAADAFVRLGTTGKPAIAKLKEVTQDKDQAARIAAGLALVAIDKRDALEAIPPLTEAVEKYVRRSEATHALAEIGAPAKSALPALWTVCNGPKNLNRVYAAEAIARIDTEQPGRGVEALVRFLTEGKKDATTRVEVGEALHRIGSAAKTAVPMLCNLLKEKETAAANLAILAVTLDPDAAKPAREWIRTRLNNGPNDEDAMDIARALSRGGPEAKPLIPEMLELLKSPDDNFRTSGARGLGRVGPGAAEALPALRELAGSDKNAGTRTAAERAIKQIEAK